MMAEIELATVVKRYDTLTAVDHISLSVERGELMGLIGPDGAGKTSIMRMLCGLLYPDAGECRLADVDVRTHTRSVRSFVGYMPQRFSLYPDLTVGENLTFFARLFQVPKADREEKMQRLLEFSRLEPFIHRRADNLSGGMKQKLALSCILIHTPPILLLDEPTTGVDPVSRREFWHILHQLKQDGVTLMVTTPYMDEAAQCDRIAFIHHGAILAIDRPDQLTASYPYILYQVSCENPVRAARILSQDPLFRSVQIFGNHLHISGVEPEETRTRVTQRLREQGITVSSIHPVDAGIEDVFVYLSTHTDNTETDLSVSQRGE